MSTPVYLLVIGKGYTEAWYQLSEENGVPASPVAPSSCRS